MDNESGFRVWGFGDVGVGFGLPSQCPFSAMKSLSLSAC